MLLCDYEHLEIGDKRSMNDEFDGEQDSSRVEDREPYLVPVLSSQQHDIHINLKNIGEEIAAFYLDGLKIQTVRNLQTAASLLGHIAKEIDSGLKDLLPPKAEVNKIKQMFAGEDFGFAPARILASLNLDIEELKSSTPLTNKDKMRIENRLKERGIHQPAFITSILTSLNLDIDNLPSQSIANRLDTAIRWIDVSTRFNEFDHKSGIGKSPRQLTDFLPLWEMFEGVLSDLVGSYLSFSRVIDQILVPKVPTKEIKDSLPNMIKQDPLAAGPRYPYFFKRLEHRGWLEPMNDAGYFNPKYNPPPQEVPDQPGYYRTPVWYAMEYVLRVAEITKNKPSVRIVRILTEIVDVFINHVNENGSRVENDRTDLQIVKIIGTFPNDSIESQHVAFLSTALKSKWKLGLVDQEIGQTILPKLLDSGKEELLLQLLGIMLEVRFVEGQIHPIMSEYWLEDTLKLHGQDIAKLCGIEALQITLEQIRNLANADEYLFNFIQLVDSDLSQISHADYTELLVSFTSCLFQFAEPDRIRKKVQDMLSDPHIIIRRLAVKTISQHYGSLKDLFWEWNGNPLDDHDLRPEMYNLIQTNSIAFDDDEMERILQWIESIQ